MIRVLTAIVHALHELRRELLQAVSDVKQIRRENKALHEEIEEFREEVKQELEYVQGQVAEIHSAVVSEPVQAVKLSDETGDNTMAEVQVGAVRQLKVEFFGASGNPTVPAGATVLNSTNTTDFTVDAGASTLTANGAPGATTDVSAVVDGVTSNVLSYTIATAGAEPVASVVLTDVTP